MDNPPRVVGFKQALEIRGLGSVTKLKRVGDRVVAETEAGVDVIVPSKPAAPTLKFSKVGDPEKW